MDLDIKGRVALVLGAGGGLGSAIATRLAEEGADVALADINADALAVTAGLVCSRGRKSKKIVWDLSDINGIDARVSDIEATLGPIDILVNNTGGPPPSTASEQNADLWRSHFESMVLSVIKISDRVLPNMRERRYGRIITSTSSGVIAPIPNLGLSNALRSSLVGWSKTLAREVAADGVTCNIVLPGRIATDRIRFLDEQKAKRENRSLEAVIAESVNSVPAGRYGTPDEYADVVTFLASARASYVTGSVIRIDGGYVQSI